MSKPRTAKSEQLRVPPHGKSPILHDWNDEDSLWILKDLTPALKPGCSRVLFNVIVVSEGQLSLAGTSMDVQMLAHVGVRERTEMEWRRLLSQMSLEIDGKIHSSHGAAESLIETVLA